ncbi:phage major capsid protein [Ancylobacter pratisalsi]|uniref:Phage major capsid protein n=1 Tax=Ancylobacter pratisalsi TaxID=1745854 RepID=A0A6P1YHM1_9HYPH|nr:phage major capsid protein [Ancylobacter pratisalsi]QIB32642.1 phage major capsid protein [Ancylobacter pratisalsi]
MQIHTRLAGGVARLVADRQGLPVICFEPPNDQGTKSAEQLAGEVKTLFQKSLDQVKEVAEKALSEAGKGIDMTNSVKEKTDDALIKMNSLMEQVADYEQKLAAARRGGEPDKEKSIGDLFVEDQKVKDFLGSAQPRGRVDMQAKATITSATTDTAGSAGAARVDTRLPGIVAPPDRRMTVRDLITPGRMDGNALEYVKETGFTNNAGMVAEAAAKPQSDIKLALVTTTAKVIAHHSKASRQILDDVAQISSYIDGRLRYGLAFKEEGQLLNGDGTGQNLLGIIPQASAFAAPITLTDPTSIDLMRLAMLQAVLAEYPATGHIMNPIDWAWVETLKDTTGRYIIGNPQGAIAPTLWGLPVVQTQAMAVDKYLTGAFRLGAQIFDRWLARVEIATENEDDFIKNLITMLCEERLALAVYRPEAFVYGDFGRVA